MKQNLNAAAGSALDTYLTAEAERLLACGYSTDADEAATAFAEKRPPVWPGK
jgi:2-(1,2-epoxy-1,2-dihydrophenyl)acetyl-CoA isomerase